MNGKEITVGWRSEPGPVRELNEDSCLANEVPSEAGASSAGWWLAAVADGAGGHSAGQVASKLALTTLQSSLATTNLPPEEAWREAFDAANRAVYNRARLVGNDMCTTLTAALTVGDGVWVGHVGDTRLYLLRDGKARQMTRDDTLVAEQLRSGVLREEQARVSEDRHVLTTAVGYASQFTVQVSYLEIRPGDRLLLSSDGVHGTLDEADIAAVSRRAATVQVFCGQLVRLAETRDGSDNMTAVAVQFGKVPASLATRRLDIRRLLAASRRRKRARVALAVVVALLVLCAGAWWLVARQNRPTAVDVPVRAAEETEGPKKTPPKEQSSGSRTKVSPAAERAASPAKKSKIANKPQPRAEPADARSRPGEVQPSPASGKPTARPGSPPEKPQPDPAGSQSQSAKPEQGNDTAASEKARNASQSGKTKPGSDK